MQADGMEDQVQIQKLDVLAAHQNRFQVSERLVLVRSAGQSPTSL